LLLYFHESEILSDHAAPRAWAPRASPRTATTVTTVTRHHGNPLTVFRRQFRTHERAKRLDREVDVLRGHVTNQEGQAVATEITHHAKHRD
jgi:hypothetical protein